MEKKKALIFGVTGQDGSFLAEELLERTMTVQESPHTYEVYGVKRRTSTNNLCRLNGVINHPDFHLLMGDVSDFSCVIDIIRKVRPDVIYNLAAQSHVGTSFEEPFSSMNITFGGCLNILEAIRRFHSECRMYQASSSEMFGNSYCERYIPLTWYDSDFDTQWCDNVYSTAGEKYQNEYTKMQPCSPYAIAKLAAHNAVQMYRKAYGIWACSGILFNHESVRRGDEFVTQKIIKYVQSFSSQKLKLGNIDSIRDWGYAVDYIKAMILMMEADKPDDYVVATGETHSVREFLEEAAKMMGINDIYNRIEIDNSLFRPNDVIYLKGDSTKIRTKLGWKPEANFKQLVKIMIDGIYS